MIDFVVVRLLIFGFAVYVLTIGFMICMFFYMIYDHWFIATKEDRKRWAKAKANMGGPY